METARLLASLLFLVTSLSLPLPELTSASSHCQRRDKRERREDASVGACHFFAFPCR